tara:strand:+ start:2504 stop:3265 length:762 start_codon:yes stop_codon:yes gene_type:complete
MVNLSNKQIILLSAGMGRRLGKLGKIQPKSLIKINHETLILRLVKILSLRKAKKIFVLVGYKSEQIKRELKKVKNISIKFIKIKNYSKYGHSYTWYSFKKFWSPQKDLLILHTDIIFNPKILDNILKSKFKSVIGIKSKKNHKLYPKSFVVKTDKKNCVLRIDYKKKLKVFSGEIIGINKISKNTMKKLFEFMRKRFLKKKNRKLSWEQVVDMFTTEKKGLLFALKNQTSHWVNINKLKDIKIAKRVFKNAQY